MVVMAFSLGTAAILATLTGVMWGEFHTKSCRVNYRKVKSCDFSKDIKCLEKLNIDFKLNFKMI